VSSFIGVSVPSSRTGSAGGVYSSSRLINPTRLLGYWNYDLITVGITDGHYTTLGYIYVEMLTESCGEACML
jgi:hypothetical protein